MKKVFQSALFRALCAIVTGGLLVMYNKYTTQWITILVGVFFFVSGVISCIAYFALSSNHALAESENVACTEEVKNVSVMKPSATMPIVGVASMILGVMLAVIPENFHDWFIYILSALLIVGALGQMFTLVSARRFAYMGWGFWILPVVILLSSVVVIVYKSRLTTAELIIGLTMLLYGITEIFNAIAIHKLKVEKTETETLQTENSSKPSVED